MQPDLAWPRIHNWSTSSYHGAESGKGVTINRSMTHNIMYRVTRLMLEDMVLYVVQTFDSYLL